MPTILELFKGSEKDTSVKADKETLVEQETTGIRFRSAVDVNNPLIYGNEAIRITQRSTPLLEDMKGGTGGESNGGLIGGKIAKARDFVNSTLGIPETQTPSRILENQDFQKSTTNIPITKDIISNNGTGLGKFLQSTGGGNPKTLGKQALGKGIGLAKDKLRGALFGEQTIGSNDVEPQVATTTNERTYTDINKSKRLPSEEGVAKDLKGTKLDLSLVSPIYGTKRKGNVETGEIQGRFGKSEYAYENKVAGYRQQTIYDPTRPYTKTEDGNLSSVQRLSLENKYGLGSSDSINLIGKDDYDSIDDYGRIKKGEEVIGEDLIPFNIGKVGGKRLPFRATITGLSENVSPSWNANKFLGNPFPYYTYTQVERNTSFNLKIFCGSPLELTKNWEKIEQLTKMSYPSINSNNLVNPPIIQFRLGDIYYDKTGFIETLTYTIPDNSTWETNGTIGFLPKFIEVAITIKFIEDKSTLNSLYGYKKSKAAIEKINEDNYANDFGGDTRAGNSDVSIGNAFNIEKQNPLKATVRGVVLSEPTLPTGDISGLNKIKSLTKGVNVSTPKDSEAGIESPIKSQSSVVDKLDGKTPVEAINSIQQENNLNKLQSTRLASLKTEYTQVDIIPKSSLSEWQKERFFTWNDDDTNVVFFKGDAPNKTVTGYIKPDGYSSTLETDLK